MTAGGFPHSEILGSKPGWRLPEAYRSLQRPSSVLSAKASTQRPCRQPTHGTRKTPYRQIPRRQIITSEMITKRSTNNKKRFNEVRSKNNRSKTEETKGSFRIARVHYPVLKPPRATRPADPEKREPSPRMGIEPHRRKPAGWRSGSPKACPYHASPRSLPHQHPHRDVTITPARHALSENTDCILRRKEVIQPHLPVRLPCYDLVPITSLTLDGSPQKG